MVLNDDKRELIPDVIKSKHQFLVSISTFGLIVSGAGG